MAEVEELTECVGQLQNEPPCLKIIERLLPAVSSLLVLEKKARLFGELTLANEKIRRFIIFKNVLAFIIGCILCIVLISLAEVYLHLFWDQEEMFDRTYEANYFFTDSDGITKALPNGRYHSVCKRMADGKIIYDTIYSIDQFSRRVTPIGSRENVKKFLLFFGGSFTFGEGLRDNETIAFFVGESAENYMAYNYGFHGHSPVEMLIKLQTKVLPKEIPQKNGILIYTYIDSHILRVIGSMRVAATWGRNRPYFYLEENGNLRRNGDFATGRPRLTAVYQLLVQSKILQLINLDIPIWITDKHLHLCARVIEEAAQSYHKQFPGSNFYVLIYPGSIYGNMLKRFLANKQIGLLDYANLFDHQAPEYALAPGDWHPNANATQVIARKVVQDLGLGEKTGNYPLGITQE